MMKQKMLKLITIFSVLLLITLTASPASAIDDKTIKEFHKLAARDAITLTIQEVKETRKFINTIQRLKSVQLNHQNTKMMPCVESIISDLSDVKSTLHRLRHLKHRDLMMDSGSLKKMTTHGVKVGKMCSRSLENVDRVLVSMLVRKLDDISVMVHGVVGHVKEVERDVYRVKTGGSV